MKADGSGGAVLVLAAAAALLTASPPVRLTAQAVDRSKPPTLQPPPALTLPNGTTVETSSDLRFEDFPSDFSKLPTVAFVIPNLHDDMHNCNPPGSVNTGDKWLRNHLDSYYQWAKKNNSLLILTFDENDDKVGYMGLTNPSFAPTKPDKCSRDVQNRTLTLFAGAHIKHGDYPEEKGIDHVTILRTLEAMFGLPKSGAQQPNAAGAAGITDDAIVTDVFMPVSK